MNGYFFTNLFTTSRVRSLESASTTIISKGCSWITRLSSRSAMYLSSFIMLRTTLTNMMDLMYIAQA